MSGNEIKYFKFFPDEYPALNLIFAGFNCPQSHIDFYSFEKWDTNLFYSWPKTSLKQSKE
jgi:hypothetical protein